jgi:hypothetical protein
MGLDGLHLGRFGLQSPEPLSEDLVLRDSLTQLSALTWLTMLLKEYDATGRGCSAWPSVTHDRLAFGTYLA